MAKEGKGKSLDEVINSVVNSSAQEAIKRIVQQHPELKSKAEYMLKHIDPRALNQHVQSYLESLSETGLKPEKLMNALGRNLVDYIGSGGAFDENAQEIILGKGMKRAERQERDKVGKVIYAFNEIYDMFKTGDYAEKMPELARAAAVIHDYGFQYSAADMLKQSGVMSLNEYRALKRAISQGVERTARKAKTHLTDYIRRAAVVLGLVGLGFLVSSMNITAAVIGTSLSARFGLPIGIGLIVISWVLMSKK